MTVGTDGARSMFPTGPEDLAEEAPEIRSRIQIVLQVGGVTQRRNQQGTENRGTLDVRKDGHNGVRILKAVTRGIAR